MMYPSIFLVKNKEKRTNKSGIACAPTSELNLSAAIYVVKIYGGCMTLLPFWMKAKEQETIAKYPKIYY